MSTNEFKKLKKESQSGVAFRKVKLALLSDFNWQAIEKLYDVVTSYLADSPEQGMLQYSIDEFDAETRQRIYEEECIYNTSLKNLTAEIYIIALVKKLELDINLITKQAFPDFNHKKKKAKDFLNGKGIHVIEPIYVEELLLLNDCIKHSSIVDDKLSNKNSIWKEDAKISDLNKHFPRFSQSVKSYVDELSRTLHISNNCEWKIIEELNYAVTLYLLQPPEQRVLQSLPHSMTKKTEVQLKYTADLKKLAAEMMIVTLYKKIEIDTKESIKVTFPEDDVEGFFKFEELKNFLLRKSISIESFTNYKEIDELRLINNRIKHDGIVSEGLSAYPSWVKGSEISGLDKHFHRFASAAESYISLMITELQKLLTV